MKIPRPIEKVLGALNVIDDEPAPSNETLSATEYGRVALEQLALMDTEAADAI